MVQHIISQIEPFISILQGTMLWSDTIRIEIDPMGNITMDVTDPEGMGCISIFSSTTTTTATISSSRRSLVPIYHIFLVDQLIEALQTFVRHDTGVYLQFTTDRAKLVNIQHEYMTQEIPICDYRPLHKFCKMERVSHHCGVQLEYPTQEWNQMIFTFCIFAGNRGSPLRYATHQEKNHNVITLQMNADAGHAVNMTIRCKPNTDIPLLELVAVPIQGQVLLHNLLNASRLITSQTITVRIDKQGIWQDVTFHGPYHAKIFHLNVPNVDPESYS
jgi:hypothetical protein